MKYSELKAKLDALTPEQLNEEIIWTGEERGGTIDDLWIVDEDQINPTGEGWEPLSVYLEAYKNDPDALEEIKDEPIVVKAGRPVLLTDGA